MPTNNSIDSSIPVEIAKGGTNATSFATTDGVCYYDGTRLVTTSVGTLGQGITSGGAGVAPTFISPYWTRLAVRTAATSADVEFLSCITSAYKDYVVVFENLIASAGAELLMNLSVDNGANWVSTNYQSGIWRLSYNSAVVTNASSTIGFYAVTNGDGTYGTSGTMFLYGLGYSATPHYTCSCHAAGTYTEFAGGVNTSANTYNAIRFTYFPAFINSGTFTLYGVSYS